jgi:acetyltransferase-like isoleucine patch superfamily enzyme
MTPAMFMRRFLLPQSVANVYLMVRHRCKISLRAEIELTRNIRLGRGVTISSFVKIKAPTGPLTVGRDSGFACFCFIAADGEGIEIGDCCVIGPGVTMVSSNYVYERLDRPYMEQGHTSKGIRIGNNVWIGAGATIADGTVIGDNTIVVANSFLNRRYPSNAIVQGNPAKVILRRS